MLPSRRCSVAWSGVWRMRLPTPSSRRLAEPWALRELVEGWPEPELERLFQLLPRSSPLLLDPASHDDGFELVRRALSARSLGTALCIRLELSGVSMGALLLVAPEGGSFTSRLLLRLRLVADTLAIALVLRDRRYRPGELSDEQMREFERSNLLAVIERCGWRLQGERGAARALGLSPSTLRDRMKSFGIQRPR